MCGIVGYSGKRSAQEVLLNGLEKLEYRGYDSAGVALALEGGIHVVKSKGRLEVLRRKLEAENLPESFCGIGHTRWATHGEPSDVNSHPHSTPRVSIVHNGIIENYGPLKADLLAKGVTFESETDTEVLVNLIAECRKDAPNLLEAFGQGQTSISLARKGDTQAVVLSLTADAPYALELRKHLDVYMPDPQRLQALLRGLPQWMETAAEPEQFPNLMEGLAITDVSVSIVFDAMLPNLSQLLAKKLGAMGPPCTEKCHRSLHDSETHRNRSLRSPNKDTKNASFR